MATHSVRRSVALSKRLMEEVSAVAPPELRGNWNRLVTVALDHFAKELRKREFEKAMARMATDPVIQKECESIRKEFATAEVDGLHDD